MTCPSSGVFARLRLMQCTALSNATCREIVNDAIADIDRYIMGFTTM
jgi:hypothetical protein